MTSAAARLTVPPVNSAAPAVKARSFRNCRVVTFTLTFLVCMAVIAAADCGLAGRGMWHSADQ